jgi:hypothetical protein
MPKGGQMVKGKASGGCKANFNIHIKDRAVPTLATNWN